MPTAKTEVPPGIAGINDIHANGLVADTDLANCLRLVRQHGVDLRFTLERGWHCWNGQRWQVGDELVMQRAKDTARQVYQEIQNPIGMIQTGSDAERQMLKWAQKSQSRQALKAMIELAESEPEIRTGIATFDSDPYLLNCNNGTIDLRTGDMRSHRRADFITQFTEIEYGPDATCPMWLEFLHRVTGGDQALLEYLQRAVGYSLTGSTIEQVLFFVFGLGANGKSVFLETVMRLSGAYGQAARTETIVQSRGGGIPNDIARLAGARLVCINETEDGQRLKEGLIKDLTGGDTISARFLHREFFDFIPTFKLWIRGNHKLQVRGTDEGIWRRIHLIPFTVKIPKHERDGELGLKLQAELPGILAWAIQGCLQWRQSGLNPPPQVVAAVEEYRSEMDVLGSFLDESVEVRGNAQATAKALYLAYRTWAGDSGEASVTQKRFGQALQERGFRKEHTRTGNVYHGLALPVANDYRGDL